MVVFEKVAFVAACVAVGCEDTAAPDALPKWVQSMKDIGLWHTERLPDESAPR